MNTDFRVVYFDVVDQGAQVGPPERHRAIKHVGAHDIDAGGDLVRRDPRARLQLGNGPVEGHLGNIALGLDRGDPVFQRRVGGIGNAVLDRLIEPLQPVLGVRQLATQHGEPLAVIRVARRLPIHEARQQAFHTLRRQQLVRQPFGHGIIEPVHRDRPALAG